MRANVQVCGRVHTLKLDLAAFDVTCTTSTAHTVPEGKHVVGARPTLTASVFRVAGKSNNS